jgi:hypothetical protein
MDAHQERSATLIIGFIPIITLIPLSLLLLGVSSSFLPRTTQILLFAYHSFSAYFEVSQFSIKANVTQDTVAHRLWLNKHAHEAALSAVFFILHIYPFLVLIFDTVTIVIGAAAGTLAFPRLKKTFEAFSANLAQSMPIKRFCGGVKVITIFWLVLCGITTEVPAYIGAAVAYFFISTLYGIAFSGGEQWIYEIADRCIRKVTEGQSGLVVNVVNGIRNVATSIAGIAKSIYPQSIVDKRG